MASAALTTTHLPTLRAQVTEWTAKQPARKGFTSAMPADGAHTDGTPEGKDVIVALRTRPPLAEETSRFIVPNADAEDVVAEGAEDATPTELEFCSGISVPSAEPGVFVAHVPAMKWNGVTLQHKKFESDLAFAPETSNEEVYRRTVVANQLLPLVIQGGVGCILAYGQTGTGKTFTMEGLEERIAHDLFTVAAKIGQRFVSADSSAGSESGAPTTGGEVFEMSVTFLELLGRQAVDLVEEPSNFDKDGNPVRKEVAVHEDKVGDVRPRLISTIVGSAEELQSLIAKSLAHRRTSATARNAQSSRSHALLNIRIRNKLLPYADEGQLILVDLAGSERYEDSKLHDKQRMDESRDNNKSLMNLKECVRAKAKMAAEDGFVHIPWRSNKLTMLLKPIFDVESRQPSKTIIIAHVSPHIQDTAHSVNTLGYAAPFKTAPPKPKGPAPYDAADPRTWNNAQTVAWLQAEFDKRERARMKAEHAVQQRRPGVKPKELNFANVKVRHRVDLARVCPDPMTARTIGKMYTVEFVESCLRSAEPWVTQSPNELAVLKQYAAEVAGQLFYLIIMAKTRTRTQIMKSRKKLDVEEVYGHNTFGDVRVTTREENGQYEFYDENDENTLQKSEAEAFSHGR